MPNQRSISRLLIIAFIALAVVGAGTYGIRRRMSNDSPVNQYQTMNGWQRISGRWREHDGIFSNPNYGRGDMLIAQRSQSSDYAVSADIRFDLLFPETHYGDAGVVIRASDPQQGVDSYQGYYAGIRPDQQTLILGRATYEWHELAAAKLASPVAVGSWYRLEVAAHGCRLHVTLTPQNGAGKTELDYQDPQCLQAGLAGLRSFYAQASWRNVKIERF